MVQPKYGDNRLDSSSQSGQDVDYSPIKHVAMTVSASDWENACLGMFTACFDASGKEHDQIAVIVAGFISSATDWVDFEKEWKERLSRDGISCFHMVEFAHSYGEFASLRNNEAKRRSLLSDLLEIIRSHAYRKFGCVISSEHMQRHMTKQNVDKFHMNAYCLAGQMSVSQVDNWALYERIKTPIEIVFENGDAGKGALQQYLAHRIPEPIFRSKRDTKTKDGVTVPGFTPLQAADLLNYELLLGMRRLETDFSKDPRWALQQIGQMPGEIKMLLPHNLKEFDSMLTGIAKLFPDVVRRGPAQERLK